jgi:hypothetical protein
VFVAKKCTTVWGVRFRDSYGRQTRETFFDSVVAKEFCGLLGVITPPAARIDVLHVLAARRSHVGDF